MILKTILKIYYLEKKRFANKFSNNYSSSISRDIFSIKEKKEFETFEENFIFKLKTQKTNTDIFTNENMISNNQLINFHTFRSISSEDEENFDTDSIKNYNQINNKKNFDFVILKKEKIYKNETNFSDRNTNYGSVIIS
jgi:hypothetical protein